VVNIEFGQWSVKSFVGGQYRIWLMVNVWSVVNIESG
jgi:hypothetical protein